MSTTPSLETTTTSSGYSITFARAGALLPFLEGLFPHVHDPTALSWMALDLGGKTFSETSKALVDQHICHIIAPHLGGVIEPRGTEVSLARQTYAMARLLLPYLVALRDDHRPFRSLVRATIHYIPAPPAPPQTETIPDISRRDTLLCKDV